MRVDLLYFTPYYPKLAEYAARRCYDSFDKCGAESHKLVRSIMSKGHLSIAQHGNIVLGVKFDPTFGVESWGKQVSSVMNMLLRAKEENNFIRWTMWTKDSNYHAVVSMNILTFIQAFKPELPTPLYGESGYNLFRNLVLEVVDGQEQLRWFYDESVALEGYNNPFLASNPSLLNPNVLVSDYEALSDVGLTDYELEYHSTVTAEIVTDRAMSLQDARHKDMMARSEISQRYVDFNDFQYRTPNGIDRDREYLIEELDNMSLTFDDMMAVINCFYKAIQEGQELSGVSKLRAKEQARAVLPNATLSRYIDTRPLRQWRHFFALRDDKHAQNEKQDDAKALIKAFRKVGITV
jgi:thymidylate synthase ThyX